MGILQGRRRTPIISGSQVQARAYDDFDELFMRRESTALLDVRRAPVDPYAVWLEQREAERERVEHEELRWVHRYRAV